MSRPEAREVEMIPIEIQELQDQIDELKAPMTEPTYLDRLRWQIAFPHICQGLLCAICRWVREHERC